MILLTLVLGGTIFARDYDAYECHFYFVTYL